MPQILKDECRKAIVDAAKDEFLQKGYNDASMRSIAQKANMTVGNLYRYFESKEEINRVIVSDTFSKIDYVLKTLTANSVSMEARVFSLVPNVKDMLKLMDELSNKLVDIYKENIIEFKILMLHSKLNEELVEWFSNVINALISQHFMLSDFDDERKILSRAYAISIFSGMREMFAISDSDADSLKSLISAYLKSYVLLLDADIKEFLG